MTDKEILKQIKGADKIKPYAVDIAAIRRGKANLALMMTLTTADHYDWFIGKFPSHNFFEYSGYRVYRRNVYQSIESVPQVEIDELYSLEKKLDRIIKENKDVYFESFSPCEERKRLIKQVYNLTPLLFKTLTDLTAKRMHYIGEICDSDDQLVFDTDLVKLYIMTNSYTDESDAISNILATYSVADSPFEPVDIDERTNWGMTKCPTSQYPLPQDDTVKRILFEDRKLTLGEVVIDNTKQSLIPHTKWTKGFHEPMGADVTIPFEKPYPLYNLPNIQRSPERTVLLTDNLMLAYQKQCSNDDYIESVVNDIYKENDRSSLYTSKNQLDHHFEISLNNEVQKKTNAQLEQMKKSEKFVFSHNPNFDSQKVAWLTARLLYLYEPHLLQESGPSECRAKSKYIDHTLHHIFRNIKHYGAKFETVYEEIRDLGFWYDNLNIPRNEFENIFLYFPLNFRDYLLNVYTALCDVIDEWKEQDRLRYQRLKLKEYSKQKFCWSSWFGEDEALADVNWRELRKRDVVFVLNADDEKSFATAIKVYMHANRICKSLKFALKKEVFEVDEMLKLAKEKYDLSTDRLQIIESKISIFEDFDPKAILEQKVDYLLEPIISDKSVTMLYAPTGIGKTWFTMCIALAISRGQPLFSDMLHSWVATKPHRVAYIDSEMTEFHFKTRLKILDPIYKASKDSKPLSFKLVAEDNINLLDEEKNYCDKITQWLNDEAANGNPVELLILDNLSTLTGFNDSAKAWDTVFSWLKTLKNKVKNRCSTIVIHHSNKKGEQRGSSAKTATVDNVIKLEREESTSDRMQFKITVEKGRDMKQIPAPFSVVLHLPTEKRAKPSFKLLLPFQSTKKNSKTRSEEAIAYLTGKKKIPHEVIAALTDLSPAFR